MVAAAAAADLRPVVHAEQRTPHTVYPGPVITGRPPTDLCRTLLVRRKPDSGLGNIRSSPAAPSRNVDWALLLAQAALTVDRLLRRLLGEPDPP